VKKSSCKVERVNEKESKENNNIYVMFRSAMNICEFANVKEMK
jgi:hypothetical protein